MRVEQLMTSNVSCCAPDDTLHRAAQLMWENDCGCLPVCGGDPRRVVGTITDRDICMSAWTQGKSLLEMQVADAMARQVHTCLPTDSLIEVERIMGDTRIRRMPVVDKGGALIGMITLADLAREAEREQAVHSREVTSEDVGMTLASICQPGQQRFAG